MVAEPADAVTFSDLSRNPRAVAERARRLGRLRVTHRDADDFYLTAAGLEEERDENLVTASRMFAALSRSAAGTVAVGDIAGAVAGRMRLEPWHALAASPLLGVSWLEFFGIGRGRVLTEGRPQEIVADPDVRRVYLGEGFRL